MKITLFLSRCCAIDSEQWWFRVFYFFTRWDWLRSLIRFRFYYLTCLRFSAELFLLWFFFTSFFASFNCFSFIDCRLDHCEIIISHYLFSLTITMRWSWNDRRRKREDYWKEEKKRRLNFAVSCVWFWI